MGAGRSYINLSELVKDKQRHTKWSAACTMESAPLG